MRKKMSKQQKTIGILRFLRHHDEPVSTTAIGRALGFRNGRPLYDAICELEAGGMVACVAETINTGSTGYSWWITAKGRREVEALEGGQP